MNIHQKINARSWYMGESSDYIQPVIEKGKTFAYTPVRVCLLTPYKFTKPVTDRPRMHWQYTMPQPNISAVYVFRNIEPDAWKQHLKTA